jgi:hypothetical protein
VDPEFLKMLSSKGLVLEEDHLEESSDLVSDSDDFTAPSAEIEYDSEGNEIMSDAEPEKTAYDLVLEKFEEEGDPHYTEKDVAGKISDFCPRGLRKWVDDAVGALVGKGYYDADGNWIQYNKLDQKLSRDAQERLRIEEKPPTPTLTFRVTRMPEGKEGYAKRTYEPPVRRTRLPADLQGRYRFGIPPEVVEELNLSPKLRLALSFEYANNSEIRVRNIIFFNLFVFFIYFYFFLFISKFE